MKAIDLPARVKLHNDTKAAMTQIAEGKLDEAQKTSAQMLKDVGRTAVQAGIEARLAFERKNPTRARELLAEALKMASPGDLMLIRLAIDLARKIGDNKFTEDVFRIALEMVPSDAAVRYAAGGYCYRKGVLPAARAHLEAAVNLRPRFIDAMRDLAILYFEMGERDRAVRVLRRACEFDPKVRDKILEIGNQRYKIPNFAGAIQAYELSVAYEPLFSSAYSNLGSVYRQCCHFEKAERALKKSIMIEPDNSGAFYNLGNLMKETGDLAQSIRSFRRALVLRPDEPTFHWNLSLALLADGELREGFEEYEWRWQTSSFPTKKRALKQPEWDGSPLEGRTLLILAEQGIGDALQFLRFVPAAVERAQAGKKKGRILLEAHEEILEVYSDYKSMVELVPRKPGEEPKFDCHYPQLSLPLMLGIDTVEDLPKAPYINAIGPERFPVPGLDAGKLNVGIVWGGNPAFPGDDIRSSKVEHYLPLFGLDGVQCYSLQKGPREADIAQAPASLVPLSKDIKSFADTVSIVRQLDVTVTTCTSVAHLVGGMGCPVFVLLSHNPDWRWLQHRDDSPWYPSARLFRQSEPGDWAGVIERVGAALSDLRDAKGIS
ncbi:tetratricopeptide repeat protein [Nisaea sediminum]|uniref:tetratricopeptide repeat protein n=1 Tax=Nisaea sediminum TaxID=2775867 RepID=UPI0018693550|nr:tetratricopeptide repeat protein [Nisaea sediminum]